MEYSVTNVRQLLKLILSFLLGSLILILPFHTLLTTFLITNFDVSTSVVFWKEIVTAIVMLLLCVDLVLITIHHKISNFKFLWPVGVFFVLIMWIVGVSLVNNIHFTSIIYGIRFELWWVGLLAILTSWKLISGQYPHTKIGNKRFDQIISFSLYTSLALSSVFALSIYLYDQTRVLDLIGYGGYNGDSQYLNPVLCHGFDQAIEGCRLSGGFTLPNHYAGYLLLAIGYCIADSSKYAKNRIRTTLLILLISISSLVIILTNSRFAYLGLLILFSWWLLAKLHRLLTRYRPSTTFGLIGIKLMYILILVIPTFVGAIAINLPSTTLATLPPFLAKQYSTNEHYLRTTASLEIIQDNPSRALIGYGAGTSGPSAKSHYVDITKNPLYDQYFDTYNSRSALGERLFVPENWYIQLLLNGGVLYTLLYILLVGYPLWKLVLHIVLSKESDVLDVSQDATSFAILSLAGIIIGNFFLHIWENQTVALYYALIPLFLNSLKPKN